MVKIEITNEKDEALGVNVKADESTPLEFFLIIKRCFDILEETTNTDIKQIKKFYKEFEKEYEKNNEE